MKPNIQRLFDAVNVFNGECRRVMRQNNPGVWEQGFKQARDDLRAKLTELGIADQFDWVEETK